MTLQEWQESTGAVVNDHPSGAKWLEPVDDWRLWRLSDFVVSSVVAGAVWLVRRRVVTQ